MTSGQYDAFGTLGRFMQADPFIRDPYNLQNYDRYGYCYNNPLTCTDPGGQLFGIDDLLVYAIIATVFADATGIIDHRTARTLYSIEAAFLLGPGGGVFQGGHRLVITTSRYSPGTTIVPSAARWPNSSRRRSSVPHSDGGLRPAGGGM